MGLLLNVYCPYVSALRFELHCVFTSLLREQAIPSKKMGEIQTCTYYLGRLDLYLTFKFLSQCRWIVALLRTFPLSGANKLVS